MEMNYETRMLRELVEINDKIYALREALQSKITDDKSKLELMSKQLEAMYTYAQTLMERLDLELQ